jgi:hypothetical protein
MVSDDVFFAWLDGELKGDEAARVEAEVASDPELSHLAEQHRSLRSQLQGAFDPIADQAVPQPLRDAVNEPDHQIIDFASAKRAREGRRWPSLPQLAAMAATLALGIFAGTMIPERSTAPVEIQGGKLYAAAALGQALDTQLASAPAGDVRIGMTFRDRAGAICRSFTETGASGLACREDGRWQLRGMFAAPEGQGGQYRMAAGMDPNLAALVDSAIAGEPFDAAQEKAVKAKGWR